MSPRQPFSPSRQSRCSTPAHSGGDCAREWRPHGTLPELEGIIKTVPYAGIHIERGPDGRSCGSARDSRTPCPRPPSGCPSSPQRSLWRRGDVVHACHDRLQHSGNWHAHVPEANILTPGSGPGHSMPPGGAALGLGYTCMHMHAYARPLHRTMPRSSTTPLTCCARAAGCSRAGSQTRRSMHVFSTQHIYAWRRSSLDASRGDCPLQQDASPLGAWARILRVAPV